VVEVLKTSTRPVKINTDEGLCLVKYIGNKQGREALVGELIGTELACNIGLKVPEFAIMDFPQMDLGLGQDNPQKGPAFCSSWVSDVMTFSPQSNLLSNIRRKEDVSKVVVLDTWLRNFDRYMSEADGGAPNQNLDNLLFGPDKRKVEMIVIDHTHIIVDGGFDDQLGDVKIENEIIEEEEIYGLFPQFVQYLNHKDVSEAIHIAAAIDRKAVQDLIGTIPMQWGLTTSQREFLEEFIYVRAQRLIGWLPHALFDQGEFNL